jgi:hypothetical protein
LQHLFTATLDCEHEFPNISSGYIVNKLVTKRWEGIRFQSPQDVAGVTRRLAGRPPFPPFASDILKAVFGVTLSCFGLPLLVLGFSFALRHWVNAASQLLRAAN